METLESDSSLRLRTLCQTENPEYIAQITRASGKTLEALAWMYGIERRTLSSLDQELYDFGRLFLDTDDSTPVLEKDGVK